MFRFGFGPALYALLLVPTLAVLTWYGARRRRRDLARFGNLAVVQKLIESVHHHARLLKSVLVMIAVGLVVLALARPQFGTRIETVARRGQDVVVALDVSASMLAEDIVPSRLTRAKRAIGSLIDQLEGDRIGLVAFAGIAFTQSPLTVDYAAARLFLDAMDPTLIPVPGTNVGAAIATGLDALETDATTHKLLILITDGEDHLGEIDEGLERAVTAGVRIHTIGIGSADGVPIPDIDSTGRRRGFKRDENGEIVLTRLDESTLERIARATGGTYFRATAGGRELDLIADDIAALEVETLATRDVTQFEEQYQLLLGVALLLLTVELILPERRRPHTEWKGRFR